MSRVVRKHIFVDFDKVRHKPGYTDTKDGKQLEFSDLGSKCRGTILAM